MHVCTYFIFITASTHRIGSVKVLDGSWYLPTAQRDPVAEFLQSRLPTAQFFELDTIADPDTSASRDGRDWLPDSWVVCTKGYAVTSVKTRVGRGCIVSTTALIPHRPATYTVPAALPHMLPLEEAFGRAADALGIQATDTIVVYDRLGAFSAPRVWWTWRVFGHQKWVVLYNGICESGGCFKTH